MLTMRRCYCADMRSLLCLFLWVSFHAQAQQEAISRFWTGVWREDAGKSSIFVPSTMLIMQAADMAYFLAEPGGGRTRLDCTHGVPCDSLSVSPLADGRLAKSGIDYKLSANGAELSVETWRVVPDGTRLTDADLYVRSTPGTGLAGSWRKVRSIEAPTTYRISVHQSRMTINIPNGELHIEFSLREANSPQGTYVSFGRGRGNRYKILGPSQLLEQSLRRGKVVAQGVITISADGQTMTEDHTDVGPQANPLHIVYDRRSSAQD